MDAIYFLDIALAVFFYLGHSWTQNTGFICPFKVFDHIDSGTPIVVAQALCLSLKQKICLLPVGIKLVCASSLGIYIQLG